MPEILTDIASPLWAYLALIGLLAIDVFVPIVPTQAVMITGGALTVYGGLSLPLTIATGALGVFAGDLAGYLLGRRGHRRRLRNGRRRTAGSRGPEPAGPPGRPGREAVELTRSRGRQAAARARRVVGRFGRGLRQPGPLVILLCRFVPGGRMLVCYHAGRERYPYRRFLAYEAAAALGWAAYGGLVGHIGGSALTGSGWRLAVIAGVAAVAFAAVGWVLTLTAGRRQTVVTPAREPSTVAPPQ